MAAPKILVADPISARGVDELAAGGLLEVTTRLGLKEPELIEAIGDFDAVVVRSETKITAAVLAAGKRLRVVGRAGVGWTMSTSKARPGAA